MMCPIKKNKKEYQLLEDNIYYAVYKSQQNQPITMVQYIQYAAFKNMWWNFSIRGIGGAIQYGNNRENIMTRIDWIKSYLVGKAAGGYRQGQPLPLIPSFRS